VLRCLEHKIYKKDNKKCQHLRNQNLHKKKHIIWFFFSLPKTSKVKKTIRLVGNKMKVNKIKETIHLFTCLLVWNSTLLPKEKIKVSKDQRKKTIFF
jgi:hypothetical protein